MEGSDPGGSLSPFDPTPGDLFNPFATLPGMPFGPWPPGDDRDSRIAAATALGQMHADTLSELDRLLAEAGSFRELMRRLLDKLEERDLISPSDNERLNALLDVYADFERERGDVEAAASRIQKIYEEAIDDPYTTPNGIAILAAAAFSAARATSLDTPRHAAGFDAGAADVAGFIYGTIVLPGAGSIAGGVAASYIAEHTHVSTHVSVTWE